jgi:hypothetical protein
MTFYLCVGFIVLAIVAVDFGLACRDAVRHGRLWWAVGSGDVVGSIGDVVVGLVVGAVTAIVVLRGRFSERLFLDDVWDRFQHSRAARILVVCGAAVLGGLVLRLLRTSWKKFESITIPRRSVITLWTCLVAAVLLPLFFIQCRFGSYPNGEPPPPAWFGLVGHGHPTVPVTWIGPRQFSTRYHGLVALMGGILAPTVLLAVGVVSLVRGFRDAKGTG